jgi:Tfp pilus assembly protein PilF
MTPIIKKSCWGLFLFLAAFLFIDTKANALDKNSSFALSHYIMGVIQEDLGNIDEAIQEYKKALKVDNDNLVIHLNLASSYIKKSDTAGAIEELNRASGIDPEAIEPHALLALLYSSKGDFDLATREYEIALKNASKLQPKNIDIYKSLGAIYLQQKKFKDAENTYRLIIDLSPNDAQAHFYLANVYNELSKNVLAEKELRRALELKPDFHQALNFLGYLYVEENRNLDEAETMIRKALELEPDNGAYVDSLGWLYFKKGNASESLKELQKATSLLEDPVIYDHLGDVYLKINDRAKAKLNWEKSLEFDPKQDKVKNKIEELNKSK